MINNSYKSFTIGYNLNLGGYLVVNKHIFDGSYTTTDIILESLCQGKEIVYNQMRWLNIQPTFIILYINSAAKWSDGFLKAISHAFDNIFKCLVF